MRGRVDAQFGMLPPHPGMAVPNLIQQFSYGMGVAELLQLKERTPFPTLGDVVQPVVILEDMRSSSRPALRRWYSMQQLTGGVGLEATYAAECIGTNPADRLVVDRITVRPISGALSFFIGIIAVSQLGGGALVSGPPPLADPRPPLDAGTLLAQFGTFTLIHVGTSAVGQQTRDTTGALPVNQEAVILGPWVIPPGLAFTISTAPVGASSSAVRVDGHEYPG